MNGPSTKGPHQSLYVHGIVLILNAELQQNASPLRRSSILPSANIETADLTARKRTSRTA